MKDKIKALRSGAQELRAKACTIYFCVESNEYYKLAKLLDEMADDLERSYVV